MSQPAQDEDPVCHCLLLLLLIHLKRTTNCTEFALVKWSCFASHRRRRLGSKAGATIEKLLVFIDPNDTMIRLPCEEANISQEGFLAKKAPRDTK